MFANHESRPLWARPILGWIVLLMLAAQAVQASTSYTIAQGGNLTLSNSDQANLSGSSLSSSRTISGYTNGTIYVDGSPRTSPVSTTRGKILFGNVEYRHNGGASTSDRIIIADGSGNRDTVFLTIVVPPSITTHPSNVTVCAGNSVSFSAAATGTPTPTVQWQKSTNNGSSWNNISGATSTTLTFTASPGDHGDRFRARFSNGVTVTTSSATLTVNAPTVISNHPNSRTACAGDVATFSASLSQGRPTPTAQWQRSTDGGVSWNNIPGANNSSYSFSASFSDNGRRYRVIYSSTCGEIADTSNEASLTVNAEPDLTDEPDGVTLCAGGTATFTATATGVPTPTVQWQRSTNGGFTWSNISGETDTILSFTTSASQDGNRYRARFSNSCGTETTSGARLTVHTPPDVNINPFDRTVCAGDLVSFFANASGDPNPSVQWQVSTDGGSTWSNVGGGTNQLYIFTTTAADDGNKYRALFSNVCNDSVPSNSADLTVRTSINITSHPANDTVCPGGMASFSVSFTGRPTPSIQWQRSTNGGSSWNNISGETDSVLTFATSLTHDGFRYRAVLTNPCDIDVSNSARLTVGASPNITAHPQDVTACYGYPATLSVTAPAPEGIPVTYQWRKEGTDIPGENGSSLTIPYADFSVSNKQYDVVVTVCSTSVTSNQARIYVQAAPVLEVTLDKQFLSPADHTLRTVNATTSSSGGCSVQVALHSITSSQSDAGAVTGDIAGDIVSDSLGITPHERTVQLRSEAGASGRLYTVVYRLTDGGYVRYDTTKVPVLPPGSTINTGPQTGGIILHDPDPNPMSSTCNLSFTLPTTCSVRMTLHTLSGTWLMDFTGFGTLTSAGTTSIAWNGRMPNGQLVPDGTYILQLKGCSAVRTKVLTIQRGN